MTNQLPNGWQQTLLVDVIDSIVGGGTPSKAIPSYYTGNIPWMTVKDMNKHVLTDTIDHITEEAVNKSSSNIIPAGIPIIATRMSLGKIITARFDSAINQDLKAIFLNENIDTKYFVFWYRSFGKNIEALGTGTTVQGIRLEVLKALPFPLCSLAEQKEIATLLDNLLAQVDTLKTRLDAIPNILKRFRQSVLAAAVSGKLTEEWRQQNSLLKENWRDLTFADLCQEITVGFVGTMKNQYKENGIPFLRSQNVRAFQFSDTNLLYISEDFHKEIYKSRLESGDLAIVRSGTPGVTCVIPKTLGIANCSDLVIARPSSELNSEFGCIYMNSEVAQKNVSANQVGVAQQHFNVGSMKKMPINLPSIKEQEEIVRRVEELFAFADQIEQRVKVAQQRVNHLTQAILAKAFRGELTAEWREQNPDLISGENSAAALLARIQAEQKLKQVLAKPARRQT